MTTAASTSSPRRGHGLLTAVALALVLALTLFEGWQMVRAPIAYGEHPAAFVGAWTAADGDGGTATLALDASGRYQERREPGRGDDARGYWGVFPARAGEAGVRFCLASTDFAIQRCAAADSLPGATGLASPRLGIRYGRPAR